MEVIFVADYRKAASVPITEVDTPRLLANANKQKKKKKNEALKPAVKTYVFTFKTLAEVQKHLETSLKSSEVVSRIDFLAHGTRATTAFSGEVVADNVLFDDPAAMTFGEFVALFTLAGWEKRGQVNALLRFHATAETWQKAVIARLAPEAIVFLFACHSGGEDTDSLTILQEGELLQATARLFERPVTGFTGYLFWSTVGTVNIYAKIPGVPMLDPTLMFHDRFKQVDKDLDFYRDLVTVKRKNFSNVSMSLTKSP